MSCEIGIRTIARAPGPTAARAAHDGGHHGQDVPVHLEHLVGEDGQRPQAVEVPPAAKIAAMRQRAITL